MPDELERKAFFAYDPLPAGSKGLVFIGDKLLTYRRDDKTDRYPLHIDLPGGGAEGCETPFKTFKRELMEEFGLPVTPDDIAYVRRYASTLMPGKHSYFPVARFPTAAYGQIVFGDEGLTYGLMTVEEFLNCPDVAWPIVKQRVRHYLKTIEAAKETV